MNPTRRQFIHIAPVAGAGLLAGLPLLSARAAAPALGADDPQAKALGYVADATKADRARFKQYAAGQHCGNCALFQGGTAAAGGCPIFPGKEVRSAGWCSAYARKAG